ncbi:hypothetical protein FQA39_LY15033 [Lamprigera yunnana]|nr:hypothetical protein FQA39_LY15033 [Lamprigera yunnana]
MLQNKHLKLQAQQMAMNVLNYFGRERDNGGAFLPFTSVMQRTTEACGISINTLTTIKKRFNNAEIENQPITKSRDVCEIYSDTFWLSLEYYEFYRKENLQYTEGDFIFTGIEINQRYVVNNLIGKGCFSKVYNVTDKINKSKVALKIISHPIDNDIGENEVNILQVVNSSTHNYKKYIAVMLNSFIWNGVMCLVLEKHYLNLKTLIDVHHNKGLSLNFIRCISKQLMKALIFLSDINIIHCDLKPSNILISDIGVLSIKLIDFGVSKVGTEKHVNSLQICTYSAPEVLIQAPCTRAIDMWSTGCILMEICTGKQLFSGFDQCDQINKIIEVLGMLPKTLLNLGTKTQKFFNKSSTGAYSLRTFSRRLYRKPASKKFIEILNLYDSGIWRRKEVKFGLTVCDYYEFINIISKMLQYDPEIRFTPEAALEHVFLDSRVKAYWEGYVRVLY